MYARRFFTNQARDFFCPFIPTNMGEKEVAGWFLVVTMRLTLCTLRSHSHSVRSIVVEGETSSSIFLELGLSAAGHASIDRLMPLFLIPRMVVASSLIPRMVVRSRFSQLVKRFARIFSLTKARPPKKTPRSEAERINRLVAIS